MAIVTGGASGLGAADAQIMAREGARVIITDINDVEGKHVAEEIGNAHFILHDVRDEKAWENVIAETLQLFGKLDMLVNNAGLVRFNDLEETSLEDFQFLNAVMSEGTFLGCKHAVGAMRQSGGGSIINVSSVAAIKGIGPIISYAASKGVILAMTRSVAVYCQ